MANRIRRIFWLLQGVVQRAALASSECAPAWICATAQHRRSASTTGTTAISQSADLTEALGPEVLEQPGAYGGLEACWGLLEGVLFFVLFSHRGEVPRKLVQNAFV